MATGISFKMATTLSTILLVSLMSEVIVGSTLRNSHSDYRVYYPNEDNRSIDFDCRHYTNTLDCHCTDVIEWSTEFTIAPNSRQPIDFEIRSQSPISYACCRKRRCDMAQLVQICQWYIFNNMTGPCFAPSTQ